MWGDVVRRVLVVLVLFTALLSSFAAIPSVIVSYQSSDDLSGSANQLNNSIIKENNFTVAADGDVSPESITSFSETSDDDTMLYPDADYNITFWDDAIAGSADYATYSGDYTDTWDDDTSYFVCGLRSGSTYEGLKLTFEFDRDSYSISYFRVVYGTYGDGAYPDMHFYNYTSSTYDLVANLDYHSGSWGEYVWSYHLAGTDYISPDGEVKFWIRVYWPSGGDHGVRIDHAQLLVDYVNPDVYVESFADVSDWLMRDFETMESISTDGDIVSFVAHKDASSDSDSFYVDIPDAYYHYWEVRYRLNTTAIGSLVLQTVTGDDGATGNINWWGLTKTTTWSTLKLHANIGTVGSFRFYIQTNDVNPGPVTLYVDYVRAANSTYFGWQHDGSTTAGTSNEGSAGWTYSLSSDGDVLTITMSHDSGTDTVSWVDIEFDTTSTVADLERDYYPFAAMQWSITSMSTTSGSSRVAVYPYVDGYAPNSPDEYFSHQNEYSTFDWKTSRTNLKAMTWETTSANGIRFWFYSYDTGENVTIKVDWVKVYSIANYTITQSGDTLTDYVLYCQDGNLIREGDEENSVWISLKSDFTISVDTSVYNVVNVTWDGSMTDGVVDWGFRDDYYGVWHFDEYDPDYVSDTYKYEGYRFTTTRDTITRFILNVYHECRISAIKFWTDNTAPTIQEKWQVPDEPTISDDLKLFVIAEESVSIYQVSVSVLQVPAGFTLDSSQLSRLSDDGVTEVWSGTVSSNLLEGDYVLRIDVTDGANSDYGYIVFSVARDSYTGYIRIFDSLGDYIPFETFEVWRNASRQYTDTFSAYVDEAYQITVKDRFGQTLNTTTFAAGTREFVLVVNVYSLKVMSWYSDFVRFNITRGGVTYSEIITPLEVVNFRLYSNTYDYAIDYLNGTSISGNINLTNSTAIIVTGSTISDVYALTTNVYQMTNHINITTTTTSNNVYTIQLMFDWTNTTLYNQTVSIIAAFNWDNTTLYNQTITLGALFNSTNTVLYNQIVLIQNMFNWQNTTLYNQTVSILNQLSNVNSTLYSQTVSILANISNVNSTIYGQTVSILNNLANVNSTLYSQTLQILTNISNVNTTLYGQTVSILSDIVNVNSTLYSQTLQILTNVSKY